MLRAVSLPGNAGVLRDLTTAYQRLVAIECTAKPEFVTKMEVFDKSSGGALRKG
jgi:hypothetical protein